VVYGGSDLFVVRGEFDALLDLDLGPDERLAVVQAWQYDAAALRQFPGLIASRRNYDVAGGLRRQRALLGRAGAVVARRGRDAGRNRRARSLAADPSLACVRASSREVYGPCEPPPGALVYFRGEDPKVGLLTKYTVVSAHPASRRQVA
jgi:hypothetical protein